MSAIWTCFEPRLQFKFNELFSGPWSEATIPISSGMVFELQIWYPKKAWANADIGHVKFLFIPGGFAFVFVAEDQASRKEYALKVRTVLKCAVSLSYSTTKLHSQIEFIEKIINAVNLFLQRLLASDEEKNKAVLQEISFLVSFHAFMKWTSNGSNSSRTGY